MKSSIRPVYRKPVLTPLHDVELPEDLPARKSGLHTVTITRLNSRQMYKARLLAKAPPTAAQLSRRRILMKEFARDCRCPDCQKPIAVGQDGDPACEDCKLVLYPPPSRYLAHVAGSYMDAMRDIRPRGVWSSRLAPIFLGHHAAEMYLKSLGAFPAFTNDDRDEYLYGDTFNHTRHVLSPLLGCVHSPIRQRLDEIFGTGGRSITDLVNAVPQNTSELFRYGLLLKDATRYEVRTTTDGYVKVGNVNLTGTVRELCGLLEEFVSEELSVLEAVVD